MVGSRWIFRALVMMVVCALPGLVFSAGPVPSHKALGKPVQVGAPSVKTGPTTAAPSHQAQAVPSKVDAAPITAKVSPDMTNTVKKLSDQVASLKRELDQLKKSGQAQSRSTKRRRFVR